jgi:hypothetical protein
MKAYASSNTNTGLRLLLCSTELYLFLRPAPPVGTVGTAGLVLGLQSIALEEDIYKRNERV